MADKFKGAKLYISIGRPNMPRAPWCVMRTSQDAATGLWHFYLTIAAHGIPLRSVKGFRTQGTAESEGMRWRSLVKGI